LHSTLRHGKAGDHKLELIDTDGMSFPRMLHEIERVFDIDARSLEIMRIDLCLDIPDVPVSWFNEHMQIRWKRNGTDSFELKNSRHRKQEIETVYYGSRPNLFRVYNKVAEWCKQYRYRQIKAKKTWGELRHF
jgi:hypothetical protein